MFLVKHVLSNPLEYFDVWIISCLKVKHVQLIAHRKTKETTDRQRKNEEFNLVKKRTRNAYKHGFLSPSR